VRLLGYELPWNSSGFEGSFFVKLEERHLEKKQKAIETYRSQKNRPYTGSAAMNAVATVRGLQAGCELAEAFQPVRWIVE